MHSVQRFCQAGIFILLVCDIMRGNVGAGIWFEMFRCVFASLAVADPDIERQCSVLHSSYLLKWNSYKCTPACCWYTSTDIQFCFRYWKKTVLFSSKMLFRFDPPTLISNITQDCPCLKFNSFLKPCFRVPYHNPNPSLEGHSVWQVSV